MISDDLRRRVDASNRFTRFTLGILALAMMIEVGVLIIGAAVGISIGDYFTLSKTVRDTAVEGSGTLSQIGTISAVEAWLQPLKVLGIALFFAGISAALYNIIRHIQLRGEAMRQALPVIIATQRSKAQ